MKKGRGMNVFVGAVVVLLALTYIASLLLAHFVMNGRRPTLEEA